MMNCQSNLQTSGADLQVVGLPLILFIYDHLRPCVLQVTVPNAIDMDRNGLSTGARSW